MSDVTLIGLGPMGSALGAAFLAQGRSLTVWNRTAGKATPLVEAGATPAESLGEAIRASPLVVACLAGYEAMREVLEHEAGALAGRALVSLGSGTPKDARDARAWAEGQGIAFLAGAIMVPPILVGRPEALFFYSGDSRVFDAQAGQLRVMGGDARYLGDDAALALVYNTALLALYWSTMTGFLHAAALAGSAGVAATGFTPVAQEFLAVPRDVMAYLAGQVDAGRYSGDAGRLTMDATAMEHLMEASRQQGISTVLPDFLHHLVDDAIAKGHAADSFASVIEVLRRGPGLEGPDQPQVSGSRPR